MGFKISWIGFDGKGKVEILQSAGLHDSGEPVEATQAPFSGAEIPGGWFILFSSDFDFVSRKRLARLSVDCRIVACQVHEGVMVSAAYSYERGNPAWEIAHDAQRSTNDLSIFGSPPPSFESIRRRLTQEQEAEVATSITSSTYLSKSPPPSATIAMTDGELRDLPGSTPDRGRGGVSIGAQRDLEIGGVNQ